MENLLEVKDLHISFHTFAGEVQAVRGVNLYVKPGETLAIVGESGCGKSVTAKSIMKLLPEHSSEYKKGEILFNGENLVRKKEREMQKIRGNEISMIFQDPMTSLNPTTKVGMQIAEAMLKHNKISRKEAYDKSIELLEMVGIPQPEKRFNQYPHEFSGGMRQRAMIAIALACNPKLIIADEPTTALDVTIQAQILELMKDIQKKTETAIILITHDLGIVAEMCDRIVVMYAGQVVENGTIEEIFDQPQHPYTKGLLKSIPRLDLNKEEPLYPIIGSPPDLLDPPKGCAFYPRCQHAMNICKYYTPDFVAINEVHSSACWLLHPLAQKKEAPKNVRSN